MQDTGVYVPANLLQKYWISDLAQSGGVEVRVRSLNHPNGVFKCVLRLDQVPVDFVFKITGRKVVERLTKIFFVFSYNLLNP